MIYVHAIHDNSTVCSKPGHRLIGIDEDVFLNTLTDDFGPVPRLLPLTDNFHSSAAAIDSPSVSAEIFDTYKLSTSTVDHDTC